MNMENMVYGYKVVIGFVLFHSKLCKCNWYFNELFILVHNWCRDKQLQPSIGVTWVRDLWVFWS